MIISKSPYKIFSLFFVMVCFFIWSHRSFGAPVPTTGSSVFSQSLKNIVIAEKEGFRVGTSNTDFWQLIQNTNNNKPSSWLFQGLGSQSTARFSIRTDKISQPQTELNQYVKKWIKEYPYLGFEILATHSMKIAGQPAYVIDLVNKNKGKQLRQFVLHNKSRQMAVIMTCTNSTSLFNSTLNHCHDILKNFQWNNL